MNNRKLPKTQALEQLIICRERLAESLHLFRLWDDLSEGRLTLKYDTNETVGDYLETLRTAFLSWIASLIDKSKDAVNIFDVWLALFPSQAARIHKVWTDNASAFELLRDFRNTTGFHGNKAVEEHLRVRAKALKSKALVNASNDFFRLAIDLVHLESQSTEFADTVKAKCNQLGIDPAVFLRRFGY